MPDTQATTRFKYNVGDLVRVDHECTYFDASIRGVEMEIIKVEPVKDGDKTVIMYHTNRPDPVLCTPFAEHELVAGVTPPPRISAKYMD